VIELTVRGSELLGAFMEMEMTYIEYIKLIFHKPKMSDKMADAILWGCTGFPEFWHSDPMRCLTKQLRHAKRSLAKGFTINQIFEGTDKYT